MQSDNEKKIADKQKKEKLKMDDLTKEKQEYAPVRHHWPVLTANYQKKDEYGDAHFIDIGQSTWSPEDFSAKIWRWCKTNRWSRQSEELPLSRALDLAILVVAAITGKQSSLQEFFQNEAQKEALHDFLTENMQIYTPKFNELLRLLQPIVQAKEESSSPNIFSFATSELSQDAIFAWLLDWANPQYATHDASLHSVAINFVRLLLGKNDFQVKQLTPGRQREHIDVWAEINNGIFLSIEDKTGTSIHDNQLARYKAIVEKRYPKWERYYAYVKTENEPLKTIIDAGYRIIRRKDLLDCLNAYNGTNTILCNYREHLRWLEKDTESFRTCIVSNWSWNAWKGFYTELEKNDVVDDWQYVANPSGGFLGAWWHRVNFNRGQIYLQFEQGKLCFKICPECDREKRSNVRNEWHARLMEKAQGQFPEIERPARFGTGSYMTIAVVNPRNLFGEGLLNLDNVIQKLKQYENLIDECCAADNQTEKQ